MKPKKSKKPWSLNSSITALLRKCWKHSPMRTLALELALVNPEAKNYDRLYRCAVCGATFYLAKIEVHHKVDGPRDESWDEWIQRIFLGVNTVTYIDTVPIVNGPMTASLEDLVKEHLEVNCKPCHARQTKEQAAKNKKPKKGKAS